MNKSNFAHGLVALLLTILTFYTLGDPWLGALSASGFYFGREVSQAEYKWLYDYREVRANMTWWQGFDVRRWSQDALADFLMPVVASFAAAAALFQLL